MTETFTIRLPDDVKGLQGKPRDAAIGLIKTEMQKLSEQAQVTSQEKSPARVHFSDLRSETGIITIFGTPEQAKAIMQYCRFHITNLLRVEVPEKKRIQEPENIARAFNTLGNQISKRIREHEIKGLKESDTKPLPTTIKIYEVADDKSSVVLHIDGNLKLANSLLRKATGLTIVEV